MQDINHRLLLGKTDKWEPWPPSTSTYSTQSYSPATYGISHLATNSSLLPLRFMYNPVLSVVLLSMRSHWQTMPVSWKYCTSNSVCVFIVFAIYPKLLNLLICCLYSTGITPTHLPLTFNPFHHGPYQDHQALYHQDSRAESYRSSYWT